MDGILPVYKPVGVTSNDVVIQLRRLLHMKRIGHSGTLDPDVDGVLPIALGAATKAVPALMAAGKTYTGTLVLGYATETEDASGAEVARVKLADPFTQSDIEAAMHALTGTITQVPPMYSAVKVNGRRLYEYARAGQTVDRPARTAHIKQFALRNPPRFDATKGEQAVDFTATVSKGTYIRTLAVDCGRLLGVPAVMTQLTRTKSGGFALDETLALADLSPTNALDTVAAAIQPVEFAYPDLPRVALTAAQWARVQNGRFLKLQASGDKVALFYAEALKAVYRQDGELYRPDVMFLANEGR